MNGSPPTISACFLAAAKSTIFSSLSYFLIVSSAVEFHTERKKNKSVRIVLTESGMSSYYGACRNLIGQRGKTIRFRTLTREGCGSCACSVGIANAVTRTAPEDLIQIFGDVDVDSLSLRMKCENGDHGLLHVEAFSPSGREAVGLRIRRLVAIKIHRVPVWREG